jgi:predicted lipoprotein
MKKYALIYLTLALFVAQGCKKDPVAEFDEKALLENIANNIILPAYSSCEASLGGLQEKNAAFIAEPTIESLAIVQEAFKETYIAFQRVKMFDFGPAATYNLKAAINTYPVDTAKINNNIATGSYTLGSAANTDAIGLPALDYLLFNGSQAEVIARFTTDPLAESYKAYLSDLLLKMTDEFTPVYTTWQSSYKTTFVDNIGTDVGSSLSILLNEFIKDLELLKNAKIGIPAGQFSGGLTYPNFVEARYSEMSLTLANASISQLKNIYTGLSGLGFDDYLAFYEEDGAAIQSADITLQFNTCMDKISALPTPFHEGVSTEVDKFATAFQEIKKLVAFAKTDMTSVLGIVITFSDTDGD